MLTDEDKSEFTAAAIALLAQYETLEAEVHRATGGVPGAVPIADAKADELMAPACRLAGIMKQLKQRYPKTPAYRFRNRLFVGPFVEGQIAILKESNIENVEG